jgi:hypothetical protein
MATLQGLFPELDSLPHADTLHRVLQTLEVVELEQAHIALLRRLLRNKKFHRYLIKQCYPIAIEGTQKLVRNGQWWGEPWLERHPQEAEGEPCVQQYVYVLEANLVLYNGVTLPLLSEFLSYELGDPDDHKQDCERNAFYRLAARLKAYFPRLPILLLLDGLYPNGPLLAKCRAYGWPFMIVLPDRCLPSIWEEVEALKPRQPNATHRQTWHGRQQHFWWVNELTYGFDNGAQQQTVHVVGAGSIQPACLVVQPAAAPTQRPRTLQPGGPPALGDRDELFDRKAPRLLLRACLFLEREGDEGLSRPDAPGAFTQRPGVGHQTSTDATHGSGRAGVFALGARELRPSLADTGVAR